MRALRRDHHRHRRRRRHARAPARRRPASASCCSSAAATSPASPRTGTPRRSSSTRATRHQRGVVRQGRAAPSARTRSTSSAATRRSTARSCSACASATSTRCATTAASRRRGRSPTPTSSPTTRRPSGSTSSTAQRGEDPTEPPASGPFPHPAVSHEPRIQQLHDDLARAGHRPFHLPVGVDLDEERPRGRALRALRPLRRLPVPDRRQGRRPRPVRAPGAASTTTSRCCTHSKVERLETDASGRSVTGVVVDRRGERGDATARTSSWSPAARSTPPRCCCARPPTSTRTAWPTPPTSSAATTWPTSTRR